MTSKKSFFTKFSVSWSNFTLLTVDRVRGAYEKKYSRSRCLKKASVASSPISVHRTNFLQQLLIRCECGFGWRSVLDVIDEYIVCYVLIFSWFTGTREETMSKFSSYSCWRRVKPTADVALFLNFKNLFAVARSDRSDRSRCTDFLYSLDAETVQCRRNSFEENFVLITQ